MPSEFADYRPGERTGPPLSDSDGLSIRPARAADIPCVARLSAEREGDRIERQVGAFERFLAQCEAGRALLLVAEVAGDLVAFGKATHSETRDGSSADPTPAGWYLAGVVVSPAWRRHGLGARLTRARLDWIARRADRAYYFANARNRVSVDLHAPFGFVEVTRDFHHPGVEFEGGAGILFACDLRAKP